MPVTFQVASHAAQPLASGSRRPNRTVRDILELACPRQWQQCAEVLQSSISTDELPSLHPRSNGPDDVWITILSQLGYYISAHRNEFRNCFADNSDERYINVVTEESRYTIDFGSATRQMTAQLHEHVVDQALTRWILPDFTTTTLVDTAICSVLMMSSTNSYFEFGMICACGIPSVTLEGEKADWQKLLDRTERLDSFGDEPKRWATMLRPILRRFVAAFDGEPDIDFWEHVAHYQPSFYGEDDLSGWISAFCVWSCKGKWQAGLEIPGIVEGSHHSVQASATSVNSQSHDRYLVLDGVPYPQMSVMFIPEGFCEVDVTLTDGSVELDCIMVAGHIAMAVTIEMEGSETNTVSPSPQWIIFLREKHGQDDGPDLMIWQDETIFSPPQKGEPLDVEVPHPVRRRRPFPCGTCVVS